MQELRLTKKDFKLEWFSGTGKGGQHRNKPSEVIEARAKAMSAKTRFLDEIIRTEGGYVDDPSDSGGETKYGVTKKTARDYGYTGPMRDLTTTTAKRIYSDLYWNKISGDQLAVRSPAIALEVADTAVVA